MRRDLGDFQTPPALVAAVIERLGRSGQRWSRVLEPTCGRGSFLAGVLGLEPKPREIVGIEFQESYVAEVRALAAGTSRVEIVRADLFGIDLRRDVRWEGQGPLLVLGNPPWVTNSELGALGSGNRPPRTNVDGRPGIEAKTGSSNFDIAEAIWRKLLVELAHEEPTIALLCKAATARRVLEFAGRAGLPVGAAELVRIDARSWFGAAVDACLLCVSLGREGNGGSVPVFSSLEAETPEAVMGFARGRLVSDLGAYRASAFADGHCPFTWRQGLKHDAAEVMELAADDQGTLRNKRGEIVEVEPQYVYPLLKGSDLDRSGTAPPRRVIVPQSRIGEETAGLERKAPRLWQYLSANAAVFDRRKSSIYRGRPAFSLFGIGPYSFAPYKVVISGLGKRPRFRAVGPVNGRPAMLDDTGYFLAEASAERAALLAATLNDPLGLGLVNSLLFRDAKRPVTKALLQRIDPRAILASADRPALLARADAELAGFADPSEIPDWPAEIDALLDAEPTASAV